MHIPVIVMLVIAVIMVIVMLAIDLWISRSGGDENESKPSDRDKS